MRVTPASRLSIWLDQHWRSAYSSYLEMRRRPLATMMTLLVIGITLALPASLLSLLKISQSVTGEQQQSASISLFLKNGIVNEKALRVAADLERRPQIDHVELLTSADAMDEFRSHSGFGDALDALDDNPLPNVLLIHLLPDNSSMDIKKLASELKQETVTDSIEYDQGWIERMQAITQAIRRAVQALGFGLGLAVMLIIGNTIRLEIMNRREEIEVTRLVGGSDDFIRRPFLYIGLIYGLLGALIAWLLVSILLMLVSGPLGRLAELYDSTISLSAFSWQALLLLIPIGISFGLAGAWLAVSRHLSSINPE
ncbi:MAG: permease-like cell division protein FtsX [Pseudomonadota bacterium]|nr:permease-like cell division protein FtsX [Pseudomonadota bacterium]